MMMDSQPTSSAEFQVADPADSGPWQTHMELELDAIVVTQLVTVREQENLDVEPPDLSQTTAMQMTAGAQRWTSLVWRLKRRYLKN